MRSLISSAVSCSDDQDTYYNDNSCDLGQSKQLNATNIVTDNEIYSYNSTPHNSFKDSDNGQIKLSLKDWTELVKEKDYIDLKYPYSIGSAHYVGVSQSLLVELQCTYDILVFNCDTKVPLLPASMALTQSHIKFSSSPVDTPTETDDSSCMAAEEGALKFFPNQTGRYIVTLVVLSNYLSNKRNGFGFSTPISTSNQISITVPRQVQIKVDPSANHQEEITTDPTSSNRSTISSSRFPPTSYIKVQWTELEHDLTLGSPTPTPVGDSLPSAAQTFASLLSKGSVPNKATVQQYSLCTVGEGVVLFKNSIKYTLVSGSLSTFEIIVGNALNIQSVDGLDIKKWEAYPVVPDSSSESNTKVTDHLVKVSLNSPVESTYTLSIVSEIIMNGTSDNIVIPSVRCRGKEISREIGFLVVESTANVQVDQVSRESLTRIDKTEVPSSLLKQTTGPILLSYKFLDPNYKIGLNITKHTDLQVLVSVIESAHFISTLSSEGSLLKKLVFLVRNTQQQYIRIKIPHQFEIWSTIVANNAVKPALDETGTVMIPLNKSTGLEKGIQNTFTVELVYKHKEDVKLSKNGGNLRITFPVVDIPISNLYVSLYLPSNYYYGDTTKSNIKEVSHFTRAPPKGLSLARGRVAQGMPPPQSQLANVNHFDKNDDDGDGEDLAGGQDNDNTAGLKPVIVNIPTTGTQIKLHQLLVLSKEIEITCKYNSHSKVGKWLLDQLQALLWRFSDFMPPTRYIRFSVIILFIAMFVKFSWFIIQKIIN
ncbi:hypothetical protein DFA_00360 [Cavenderia fasciculata]|uniref:Uncharacterized protein n=1 Tax=Cavenderia fasciculata TaxID=261658 RepID=F4PRE7_CACFS|nr:uncharacterized protein DFA_00360 [Cavenderia fasciculata]EGG20499.1 hypothetical protein DFA_00360 [Cavenderia fasciculata]|eukprot:XP_004358349.1 hypothetical protein DFA_00360 [Cavenderia fasciculata]